MFIHILTEKQGIGLPYMERLISQLAAEGHEAEIIFSHDNCPSGELMFILGYLKIIPRDYLSRHKSNLVIHASDLPHGKGWSPVAWQILEGENSIPFTLFEACEELDAGDIYLQKNLELSGNEMFSEWRHMQWMMINEMVMDFVSIYPNHRATPQQGESTFYRRRRMADDELDVNLSLAENFNKIRICDPEKYPAWFDYKGRRYELRITPVESDDPIKDCYPSHS